MDRTSVPTIAELYEMFPHCALEFDTVYAFRIPKVNQLIAVIKFKSGNDEPGCGYGTIRVIDTIGDSSTGSLPLDYAYDDLMTILRRSFDT